MHVLSRHDRVSDGHPPFRAGGDEDGPYRYSAERFEEIVSEFRVFARDLGVPDVVAIPVSGLKG